MLVHFCGDVLQLLAHHHVRRTPTAHLVVVLVQREGRLTARDFDDLVEALVGLVACEHGAGILVEDAETTHYRAQVEGDYAIVKAGAVTAPPTDLEKELDVKDLKTQELRAFEETVQG